jgi:tRNA dimethylallyltransferase
MLDAGLEQEARQLLESGDLAGTAAQAIGYKEMLAYFRGEATLEQAADLIRQKSRNYAKRQLTWFQRDDRVHWITYNQPESEAEVFRIATNFLQEQGL